VFGREGVWRSGDAQDGADEAKGGPVWAGVTEALGGGGAIKGGASRWLAVWECCTRRHGARGGDEELRGGPGAALHGGSTTTEQGDAVGVTSGRKKCY
jgi:hypothetical protein